MGKYYNPCFLYLSDKEYDVLKEFPDGRKLIQLKNIAKTTIMAFPEDLDGTYEKICKKRWKDEYMKTIFAPGWERDFEND